MNLPDIVQSLYTIWRSRNFVCGVVDDIASRRLFWKTIS